MAKRERCLFCGGAADLLCDGYLGWGVVMDGKRRCIDIHKPYTCDAPLCKACCGTRASIHGIGWFDTIDHCPLCIADGKPASWINTLFDTPEQARIVRDGHHARVRNRSGRPLELLKGGGQMPLLFE